MQEKIDQELEKLQQELQNLDSAVQQISRAEKISTEVVSSVQSLNIKFKAQMNEVAKRFDEYLKANVQTSQQQVQSLVESHAKQVREVSGILSKYVNLAEVTSKIADRMETLDLAPQFQKIDQKMAALEGESQKIRQVDATASALNESSKRVEKHLVEIGAFQKQVANEQQERGAALVQKIETQAADAGATQRIGQEILQKLEAMEVQTNHNLGLLQQKNDKLQAHVLEVQKKLVRQDRRIRSARRWTIITFFLGIPLGAMLALALLKGLGYEISFLPLKEMFSNLFGG